MRFTYFVLALALLTLSASAQDKKDAARQSPTSVMINGQAVKGKVIEIDGKHFVAVEDLVQSLQGTISYGEGRIALTFSQLQPMTAQPTSPQVPSTEAQPHSPQLPTVDSQQQSSRLPSVDSQPPGTGRVKGTLSYFFDFHTGNQPDSGSKVWLVKGRVEIPADQHFVGTSAAVGTSSNPEEYNAIEYSITDKNGNFEFVDILPGQYTLIIQSAHTKGTLNEKMNFFGRGDGRTPETAMDALNFSTY